MQARSNTNKAKQHSTPKAVTLLEKMSCLGWDMYMYCMRIANALRRGLALLCLSFNRGWWIGVAVISKTRHPARRSCRGFESRTHAGGLQALGKQARRRSRVILFSCGKQQCRRAIGTGLNVHSTEADSMRIHFCTVWTGWKFLSPVSTMAIWPSLYSWVS